MKTIACKTLPLFITLPLLVTSCEKKSAPSSAENVAAVVPADAPVILAKRGYLPPAGTKTGMELSIAMEDANVQIDAGGQQMQGKVNQSTKGSETLEFLPGEKIRRTVVSKKISGKMTINGMDQPIPDSSDPLEGSTVLLSKTDGKWTAALEDGSSPTEAQLTAIEKMAKPLNNESDAETYGEAPRKIGDKWEVDPTKIGSFGEAENLTGTYSVEFVRVEDYQGTPCAVLKAKIDLKGTTASKGRGSMKMRIRGDVMTHRSLKDMTDLQVVTSGSVDLDGAPAPGFSMHMEGPIRLTQKVTVTRP
ncbi:hypothetical protein JIN84_08105 [Luteolibacter yonseiensis]|uniref:Uncharacterized protein n=1 Tax=Luteolibacter yonseiensis TaxID=1144680 RepID=A0A934VBM4_9BACT|nr:hypothetical protein [Luteolibacter yonseiensis]MBK1815574.1 hypothetical protein [Luteolibacter yonseiensis]